MANRFRLLQRDAANGRWPWQAPPQGTSLIPRLSTMEGMIQKRCDRCELIVGEGCDCPGDGSPPRRLTGVSAAPRAPRNFTFDTILVAPEGYAHIPGACFHRVDSPDAAGWGWIPNADSAQWTRISERHPAQATAGNAKHRAKWRCPDCAYFIGVG